MKGRLLRAMLCWVVPFSCHSQLKLETEQLRTVLRMLSCSEMCKKWRRKEKILWVTDSPSNLQGRWDAQLDCGSTDLFQSGSFLYLEEEELSGISLIRACEILSQAWELLPGEEGGRDRRARPELACASSRMALGASGGGGAAEREGLLTAPAPSCGAAQRLANTRIGWSQPCPWGNDSMIFVTEA